MHESQNLKKYALLKKLHFCQSLPIGAKWNVNGKYALKVKI